MRAFVGLLEGGVFRVRWGAESGRPGPVDLVFPEGAASRALLNKEPFWTNHPSKVPGANLKMIAKLNVRQVLAVPLLGTEGRLLGVLGVLDRLDRLGISQENVRSAQALAAQIAVTLEGARNLHLSQQHRRRAEALKGLALELNSQLRFPECARNFVTRAADLMGAQAAAFAVQQGPALETLVLHGGSTPDPALDSLLRRFDHALAEALAHYVPEIVSGNAAELFGSELGSLLGWDDCSLIRLLSSSHDLVGVLCLANRGKPLQEDDGELLRAIAAHASVALENARLFTRMDQANRHWIEIFDAITRFHRRPRSIRSRSAREPFPGRFHWGSAA